MDMPSTPQAAVSISAAALVVPQRSFYRHYVLALLTGIYAVNVIDRFVVSIVTEQLKTVFPLRFSAPRLLPAGWRRASRSY
jgi:hypothetical protein